MKFDLSPDEVMDLAEVVDTSGYDALIRLVERMAHEYRMRLPHEVVSNGDYRNLAHKVVSLEQLASMMREIKSTLMIEGRKEV